MKSLVVSVCITAVTDMAAVSLLVFFWVLLAFFWCSSVLSNTRRTPEGTKERQKNPEEQKNPEPRGRRTPAATPFKAANRK